MNIFHLRFLISLFRYSFITYLIFIFSIQISNAAVNCDKGFISKVANNFHPKRVINPSTDIDDVLSVCKVKPSDSSKNIVILVFPNPTDPPSEDMTNYDIDVLIVDAASGNVLSRWWQEAALTSDAMGIQEIAIDTARYNLATNVRAFGMRVRYKNHSQVFPASDETLTLFLSDGKLLRPVLDSLYTYQQNGENSAGNDCSDETNTIRRTVSIDDDFKQGYHDLVIHEIVDSTKTKPPKCKTIFTKPITREYKIQYKNNKYTLPKSLM